MKSAIVTSSLLVAVIAQSAIPQCAQECINGMYQKAASLGCSTADANCLCTKANFGYGVRDCSAQYCTKGTDLSALANFVIGYCSGASASGSQLAATGVFASVGSDAAASAAQSQGAGYTPTGAVAGASTGSAGSAGASGSGSATESGAAGTTSSAAGGSGQTGTPVVTEPLYGIVTSGGSTLTTITGSTTLFPPASAVTTEAINGASVTLYALPIVTVVTESNGSVVTSTVGTQTIGGTAGIAGATGSASGSASSAASSASESASSVASSASSAAGSASSAISSAASSASSAAGGATSTSSGFAAATKIAAHGIAGVAGVVAVMLL